MTFRRDTDMTQLPLKTLRVKQERLMKTGSSSVPNYFNDPFFIDISEIENNFPVYYARHGMGIWVPIKKAESLTDFTERLKQIKIVENNREQLLEKLRSDFDLQNEFWKEVYESTLEEEE